MKYFLILNPGSRSGNSKKNFKIIVDTFNKAKVDFEYKITNELEDAYYFSKEANLRNVYETIVAVGGDGTINKVLNGFYDENGLRVSKSKFAVIYTGTSPDFCKSYNIPISIWEAMQAILMNETKKIEIGKISYINSNIDNKKSFVFNKVRYFACCTNIGIGASIARFSNKYRKYTGDFVGTFLSMIVSLMNFESGSYKVIFDEYEKEFKNVVNISIGKTKYIASGIKVKNNIEFGSKKFYCMVVKNLNLLNFVKLIKQIYTGKIKNSEYLEFYYLNKVYIERIDKCGEIEFDGDPAGYIPCIIENGEPMEIIKRSDFVKRREELQTEELL